jgi:hypothetical protein
MPKSSSSLEPYYPIMIKNYKKDRKEKVDAARMVIWEDYYRNKEMKVRDAATVQEQNKNRRVEMGAK